MDRKQIGRIGLTKAIDYFTIQGYCVLLPLNDTQWYDLVVEKDNQFYTVQCKATTTKDDSIDFRSTGGTNGSVYDNLLNHPCDYLFCVNKDFDCWNIPVSDILKAGNKHSIKLRKKSNANNQGFNTYKYLCNLNASFA